MSDVYCSPAHLDYLQRTGTLSLKELADSPCTFAPPSSRRLYRVQGISLLEKNQKPTAPPQAKPNVPSEEVLMGLYGNKIPVAFNLLGQRERVVIQIGTWLPTRGERKARPQITDQQMILDERQEMLHAVLQSSYLSVSLNESRIDSPLLPLSGLVLGIPAMKAADSQDGSLPIDRLIRALNGSNWSVLVLAEPVDESVTSCLRSDVIKELRTVQASRDVERLSSPIVEHYTELLQGVLKTLTAGIAIGTWRTSVYLQGDLQSYYRLASVWRAVFSDSESLFEPVRVWDSSIVGTLASQWALSDMQAEPGPGHYDHLLRYQTLLTSKQLAAYVHLPQRETNGYTVDLMPNFDSVPPPQSSAKSLMLGNVVQRRVVTQARYEINLSNLSSHAFVAGLTGSGKTTTVKHILKEASAANVPFLVIEPAKTEYRNLLADIDSPANLQVFTLGNELVSPFRLNPFEVVGWPKTSIGVHIDLIRSAFTASFGMWTPLPQVLERCLHRIYEDRGWDITTNENFRLRDGGDVSSSFPTLSELAARIGPVTHEFGYEDKVTADIQAALLARVNGLRAGGKGRMLDVQFSIPMEVLLGMPAVLELEGMGDDDDKTFLIGLLLTRLVEYRRASLNAKAEVRTKNDRNAEIDKLVHLLVIEEAHRLLANVGVRRKAEEADPHGKAVEVFSNLLSEIRAYGQGVIVVDQVPSKLTPDVIKNTNLKIAHRVVAADDRELLAGAMAMDKQQMQALAILERGQAAVFSEGDDAPLLLKIVSPHNEQSVVSDAELTRRRRDSGFNDRFRWIFEPLAQYVDLSQPTAILARDAAQILAADQKFQRDFVRLITSLVNDPSALGRLFEGVLDRTRRLPAHLDQRVVRRCLMIFAAEWFAHHRGRQIGWSYSETLECESALRRMLLAQLEHQDVTELTRLFCECVRRLHARKTLPYQGCNTICKEGKLCLYRHAVTDLAERDRTKRLDEWASAYDDGGLAKNWELCEEAAYQLIEPNAVHAEAVRRIGLCYAQTMLVDHFPEIQAEALKQLGEQARLKSGGN